MVTRILHIIFFVFVIALTENTVKGVHRTDEEVVNEVLHLPTPNEIIEEIENDPSFWDERNVRFQLAATFGKLQFESFKKMDENLKIMVAGTVREIKKVNLTNWNSILNFLDAVPYLKMVGERRDYSEGYIIIPKLKLNDLDEGFDAAAAYKIEVWFERLVRNYDILKELNINITKLANFVAKGENITSANSLFGGEYRRKALMDLAILRFPDITHPYFMVFTVQLIAYRESLRLLIIERGSCGVLCRFNYAKYKPNYKYIKKLRKETREGLTKDLKILFNKE